MSWQLLIVVVVVAASGMVVARRAWRFWRGAPGGDSSRACGTCGSCESAKPSVGETGGGFVSLETLRDRAADESARQTTDHPAIQR